MQIVAPPRCSSRSRSITASPLRESRLPVGSSASRISGSPAAAGGTRPRAPSPPRGGGGSHGDALLLTAGELAGQVFGAVGHTDAFERRFDALLALGRLHAAVGE